MRHFLTFRHGDWIAMLLWLGMLSYSTPTQAQCLCGMDPVPTSPGGTARNSCLGQAHTPHGHLNVLMIYIYYPDTSFANFGSAWPNDPTLPEIAQDTLPGMNQMLTDDTTTLKNNLNYPNISQYYYRMSDGKFLLTGDVYEQQVPVTWTGNFGQMEQAAIDWIVANDPGFDWGKYDNRTNMSNGVGNEFSWDNSQSPGDSVLDYVAFVHRRGNGRSGAASNSVFSIGSTGYSTQWTHRITVANTFLKDNREIFIHELAHNLYAGNHYMGTNNVMGRRLSSYFGWGMIATGVPILLTANAWERWYLGWL